MHISLLVGVVLILILGEEIVGLLLHHGGEWLIVLAGILLAVALFYFGCRAAWDTWEWFRGTVGDTAAHMVADPLIVGSVVVGLPLLWIDSVQNFKQTARFFRFIARRKVVA